MDDLGVCPKESPAATTISRMESLRLRLANLDGATGCFTGKAIDYQIRCTVAEGKPCQIVRHISVWNELLLFLGLELRHFVGKRGTLCIARCSGSRYNRSGVTARGLTLHQAATVLHWLLRTHRCIVSVHIVPFILRCEPEILYDALRANTVMKKLTIGFAGTEMPQHICSLIPFLLQLKEFVCSSYGTSAPFFVDALAKLLAKTTSLETLWIPELELDFYKDEQLFFSALTNNRTLKELSMRYGGSTDAYHSAFRNYLECTIALTALEITASSQDGRQMSSILEAVLRNKTLQTLTLKRFSLNQTSAALVVKVLSENKVLRAFHIVRVFSIPQVLPDTLSDDWLLGIKENEALEELTLPVNVWQPVRWEQFFMLLLEKKSLRCVTVQPGLYDEDVLKQLCNALRESGSETKVCLGNLYFHGSHSDSFEWAECKSFSNLYIMNYRQSSSESSVLQRLASLSHITWASLNLREGDLVHSEALAEYIKSTTALRKVRLSMCHEDGIVHATNAWWSVVIQAISRNTAIKNVSLCASHIGAEELEYFADVVKSSKFITAIELSTEPSADVSIFLRRLSENISDNYTLLRADLHCELEPSASFFSVMDTLRRNSDMVTRAALFAKEPRCDGYHAAAFEQVSRYPALLREVAELASLSEEEVATRARALRGGAGDLHGYMRFAGVVKDRVVCHSRLDARMQLDELNYDSWSHVRAFLKLDDVTEPVALQVDDECIDQLVGGCPP